MDESQYMLKSSIVGCAEQEDWELRLIKSVAPRRFVHLTYVENVPVILGKGFIPGDGNMGEGVYCADISNRKSIESLIAFSSDLTEGEDEMGIVVGYYTGESLECVEGKEHFSYNEGFILLKETDKIKIKSTHIIDVAWLSCFLKTVVESEEG